MSDLGCNLRSRAPLSPRTAVALALAVIALLIVAAGARADATPFAPASVWNAPLPSDAPLDPNSANLVSELIRQKDTYGDWINTYKWSTPVYTVPLAHRYWVNIASSSAMYTNATDAATLQKQIWTVPIPLGARPAAGTDHHMVVYQPATDTLWELWGAHNWGTESDPNWSAAWGEKITGVSTSDGIIPAPFGATASGEPLLGGLIRISDLQSGSIDHAIAIGLPDVQTNSFVWPATRTDGIYSGTNAIPEGERFRLDPTLDVDSLDLPPAARMIAHAAQKYGIIVRDRAGSVTFFGEDPTPLGTNPYGSLFGGLSPSALLANFPWDRLQAVCPPDADCAPSSGTAPATTTGTDPATTDTTSTSGADPATSDSTSPSGTDPTAGSTADPTATGSTPSTPPDAPTTPASRTDAAGTASDQAPGSSCPDPDCGTGSALDALVGATDPAPTTTVATFTPPPTNLQWSTGSAAGHAIATQKPAGRAASHRRKPHKHRRHPRRPRRLKR